jgi:hydrogenase expression/formation protein HypC
MCLAIPAKILKIENKKATAQFGSLIKEIDTGFVEGLKKGDYVIVHAGFAIQKLDESQAKTTLDLLNEIK